MSRRKVVAWAGVDVSGHVWLERTQEQAHRMSDGGDVFALVRDDPAADEVVKAAVKFVESGVDFLAEAILAREVRAYQRKHAKRGAR